MIEVLVNDVTLEGLRRVKVVSDSPICAAEVFPSHLLPISLEGKTVNTWSDDLLGLHYLESTWACREAVLIRCEGWECPRPMVLWKLGPGERVSEVLNRMMVLFGDRFKAFPDYAFMKKLPKTIENGFEVADVMMIEAEWVPAGCIAICKGEHYGFEAMAVQE